MEWLSDETLLLIAQWLDVHSVGSLSLCCKQLNILLRDDRLWRGFCCRDWGNVYTRYIEVLSMNMAVESKRESSHLFGHRELYIHLKNNVFTSSHGSNDGPDDWGVPSQPPPSFGCLGEGPVRAVRAVSCGGFHSVFVTFTGAMYTVGANAFGQLGCGDRISRQQLVLVQEDVRFAAAGYAFTMVVCNDGRVMSCGFAKNGRCGIPDEEIRVLSEDGFPLLLSLQEARVFRRFCAIQSIVCGSGHGLGLLDGRIYSWGRNDCGQCGVVARGGEIQRDFQVGVAATPLSHTPLLVDGLPSADARECSLFAGSYHSLALVNGTLWGWGLNTEKAADPMSSESHIVRPARWPHSNVTVVQASSFQTFLFKSDPHEFVYVAAARGGSFAHPDVACIAMPWGLVRRDGRFPGPLSREAGHVLSCHCGQNFCVRLCLRKLHAE